MHVSCLASISTSPPSLRQDSNTVALSVLRPSAMLCDLAMARCVGPQHEPSPVLGSASTVNILLTSVTDVHLHGAFAAKAGYCARADHLSVEALPTRREACAL